MAEARARFQLGKATRTDVAQLEAQRASANATLASAQATLETAKAGYRAAVGHDPGELASPPSLGPLPATLDQARADALAANPLYQQSLRAADAADARIQEARANRAPTVSLGACYGYDVRFSGMRDRDFPRAANAGVSLHVPILTGGLVASQVRQAGVDAADLALKGVRAEYGFDLRTTLDILVALAQS